MGFTVDFADVAARSQWEAKVELEIRPKDPLLDPDAGLLGTDTGSLILEKDELLSGGKQLYVHFGYQNRSRGKGNNEQLVGAEQGFDYATDTVALGILRNAWSIDDGGLTDQYVAFDTAKAIADVAADWAADRLSFALHTHAAGISLVTDDVYRLYNTIDALNTSYIFRPNGKAAGALLASDVFDINLLKDVGQFVKTVRPKIRPAQTPWGPKYCVFISPEQSRSLQEDDSSWYAAMLASLKGGNQKSGVFTRVLGEFQDFLIFESDYIPPGIDGAGTGFKANTRRAWVGGAGALSVAYGRGWKADPGYDINRWKWIKESRDFDENRAMGIRTMCGVNRLRYTDPRDATAKEAGIVVVETYVSHGNLTSAQAFQPWTEAAPTVAIT